jgi:Protein of unknown function (DUF5672)
MRIPACVTLAESRALFDEGHMTRQNKRDIFNRVSFMRFPVCVAIVTFAALATQAQTLLPRSRFRAVTVLHAPCNTLSFTLANVAGVLGTGWPIAVFYNDDLADFIASTKLVRLLVNEGRLDKVPLRHHGFATLSTSSTDDYSRLLMSPDFWRFVNADQALVFQTDSVLCSLSPWRIDDFLQYDYIGAPWMVPMHGLDVGNGGLSLRNVSLMLDITETYRPGLDEHEDVYFARSFGMMLRVGKQVRLPSPHVAASFAYETGMPPVLTSFGVHKLDAVRWGPDGQRHVTPNAEVVATTCPEVVAGVLLSCNVSEYQEGKNAITDMFLAAPNLVIGGGAQGG